MARGVRKAQSTLVERVQKGAPERPADSIWDALSDMEEPTSEDQPVGSRRLDIEAETPGPIKARIDQAYEVYSENATDDSGEWFESKAKLAAATAKSWRTQPCGSEEAAVEFIRLAKRYCNKREERLTFRGAQVPTDKTRVRFVVKPFEAR